MASCSYNLCEIFFLLFYSVVEHEEQMRLFGPLHPLVHFPFQNMDHLPYCY